MRGTAALAGLMVGLLGGCGSSHPAPSESGTGQVNERGAVPWVDRPGSMFMAAPIPTPPRPADARPCRAADLQVSFVTPNGGGGHHTQTFAFRNVSTTACLLAGYPRVVASEPGRPDVLATAGGFFVGHGDQSADMGPGQSTDLSIETDYNCPARDGRTAGDVYRTLTVTIPGGGSIRLPASADVTCGLFTGAFDVPVVQTYTRSPVEGATATLELPTAVPAGTTLRYVVDLRNPTRHDMVLSPCPSYDQGIGRAGKLADILELNCDRVTRLPADGTVRYAMQLAVPRDFPTGTTAVYWMIAGVLDVAARGRLAVLAPDRP